MSGTLFTDNLFFTSVDVSNVTMMLAESWSFKSSYADTGGVLGLGQTSYGGNASGTILDSMVLQQLIPSRLYSIWLTDESKSGPHFLRNCFGF